MLKTKSTYTSLVKKAIFAYNNNPEIIYKLVYNKCPLAPVGWSCMYDPYYDKMLTLGFQDWYLSLDDDKVIVLETYLRSR